MQTMTYFVPLSTEFCRMYFCLLFYEYRELLCSCTGVFLCFFAYYLIGKYAYLDATSESLNHSLNQFVKKMLIYSVLYVETERKKKKIYGDKYSVLTWTIV